MQPGDYVITREEPWIFGVIQQIDPHGVVMISQMQLNNAHNIFSTKKSVRELW